MVRLASGPSGPVHAWARIMPAAPQPPAPSIQAEQPIRWPRWTQWARLIPLLVIAPLIAFLALREEPSVHGVPGLPRSLVHFFDSHDFLNNVTGFAALAASMHLAFGRRREPRRRMAFRAGGVAAAVVALEIAQIWLPARSCDWKDVLAGWLGITVASVLSAIVSRWSPPHAC